MKKLKFIRRSCVRSVVLGSVRNTKNRSKQRWGDRVKDDMGLLGILNEEQFATHRTTWWKIVEAGP